MPNKIEKLNKEESLILLFGLIEILNKAMPILIKAIKDYRKEHENSKRN